MAKDLHIHIERGPYTLDWIEKFIFKACEMGLEEICLLEHSVRFKEFIPTFKEAYEYNNYQKKWLDEKIPLAHSINDFKKLAGAVRSENYPIKVSFGLEICWFEQHEDLIENLVSDGFFDYLLGSVHWIDNWTFNQRKYQWLGKNVDEIYSRYFELENSLVQSNIFDIIAHPDLIMCHSLYPSYDLSNEYERLCRNIKAHNMCLEMNTSKSMGVNKEFFDIAVRNGVKFSTGSDAHRVEDVGKNINEITQMILNSSRN